jgi:hypothetical protein
VNRLDLKEYLDLACKRNGLIRHSYEDKNIPNEFENICVMPFFGDTRHTFLASSLLMRRYREETKGSKYFVLISWPGHQNLFSCADEFWSPDPSLAKKLLSGVSRFSNKSDAYSLMLTGVLESFRDVSKPEVFNEYHYNGIQQAFWDRYRHVKVWLPQISSHAVLNKEFSREVAAAPGYKVLLLPTLSVDSWKLGRVVQTPVHRDFWIALVKHLKREGFAPVVVRNYNTYDISQDTAADAVHLADPDVNKLTAAMRLCGCVLDVFNGASRYAIAARTPYLCCDERSRYFGSRDYEVDDLCGSKVPREYVYTFSSICQMPAPYWEPSLFRHVTMKLQEFLPGLDRDRWPLTTETNQIVPYDSVRKIKRKKLGTKLLKIIRD